MDREREGEVTRREGERLALQTEEERWHYPTRKGLR